MRIGIIARAELGRGLSIQTWEACRGLKPERVLLIEPHNPRAVGPWPQCPERYAQWQTTVVRWGPDEYLDDAAVRSFLADVDVVYSAETLYDWRIADLAAEYRVGVVIHMNPEMLRDDRWRVPGVTWWLPTPWLAERYPGARVVPMPVATDRFEPRHARGRVVFLHVAGHQAIWDRNGTQALADAWHLLAPQTRQCFRIVGQDGYLPGFPGAPRVEPNGVENYWDLYAGADVLVMPRRFGGLCLPVQEACAAGLAPLMLDVSPNEIWPGPRLAPSGSRTERAVGGRLPVADVHPLELAAELERLAADRDEVAKHQGEAVAWAQEHSWPALRGLWLRELEAACR